MNKEISETALVNTLDKIKYKAVDLWHDLQANDLTLEEYEEARDFIINLFLEDK